MLATDLSNAEIVLGKLGVRLVPVFGLIACVLPLTTLTSLAGRHRSTCVLGLFTTAVACATLACSLSLTLSLWGRKTHEVLMGTYLILVLWLISPLLVPFVAASFGLSSPVLFRACELGMDRVLESVLPCLRALFQSRQGGIHKLYRFLARMYICIRLASMPGNTANSSGSLGASYAVTTRYTTTVARPTFAHTSMAIMASRSNTRQ